MIHGKNLQILCKFIAIDQSRKGFVRAPLLAIQLHDTYCQILKYHKSYTLFTFCETLSSFPRRILQFINDILPIPVHEIGRNKMMNNSPCKKRKIVA